MDNPQHSLDDALVEKVARAIASVCFETEWDSLSGDTRACFFPYARAALEAAGVAELLEENERLREALLAVKRCKDTAIRGKAFVNLAHLRKAMPLVDAALNPRQNEEEGE